MRQEHALRRPAQWFAAALAAMLIAAAPARADESAGLAAFQAGRFAEAVQAWQDAAEEGNARAALYLGAAYDTGIGVTSDYREALAWYRRAAEAGSVVGMFNVAVMYDAGRGTPPDPAAAAPWYERAAAKGFGRAEYNLALMNETGSGVPRDKQRAVQLYRAAAGHGVPAAIGHLTQLGVRLAPNPGPTTAKRPDDSGMEAFEQAQRMFLARDPAAAQRAAALFRQAAEAGNPLAQYDLAYCYEHGIGVPADMSEAVRWFRLSAAKAPNATMRAMAEAGVVDVTAKVSHAQR